MLRRLFLQCHLYQCSPYLFLLRDFLLHWNQVNREKNERSATILGIMHPRSMAQWQTVAPKRACGRFDANEKQNWAQKSADGCQPPQSVFCIRYVHENLSHSSDTFMETMPTMMNDHKQFNLEQSWPWFTDAGTDYAQTPCASESLSMNWTQLFWMPPGKHSLIIYLRICTPTLWFIHFSSQSQVLWRRICV